MNMNEFIRTAAGRNRLAPGTAETVATVPPSQPQWVNANAGAGTGAPPPEKRDMNSFLRERAAGRRLD